MAPSVLMLLQAATVIVPGEAGTGCLPHLDEIVVCHKPIATGSFRLPLRGDALPADPIGPPRAEWGLGGGVRMGVVAQSQAMPQGAVSERAMVSVKIPF